MLEDARNMTSGLLATIGGHLLVPIYFLWSDERVVEDHRGAVLAITVITGLLLVGAFALQWTDPEEKSWHVPLLFALVGAALWLVFGLVVIYFSDH